MHRKLTKRDLIAIAYDACLKEGEREREGGRGRDVLDEGEEALLGGDDVVGGSGDPAEDGGPERPRLGRLLLRRRRRSPELGCGVRDVLRHPLDRARPARAREEVHAKIGARIDERKNSRGRYEIFRRSSRDSRLPTIYIYVELAASPLAMKVQMQMQMLTSRKWVPHGVVLFCVLCCPRILGKGRNRRPLIFRII